MRKLWITADELAAKSKVSVKSISRAYRKSEIPVDRFCRFVRFDLERVKEALQAKGLWPSFVEAERKRGPRSATGGASRRRAKPPSPRLGKTGRLSHRPQGGRNDRFRRIHSDHRLAGLHFAEG